VLRSATRNGGLDALLSLLAACRVLLLGTALSQRVALPARYSIPSPIVGGVLFAIAAAVLALHRYGATWPISQGVFDAFLENSTALSINSSYTAPPRAS